MLEDKLYESDYFNIYVCQTYRTQYNKIKEEYHKELCIYLDFESDIFNYLFVALTYDKKNKTIFTYLKYDDYLPNDMNCLRHQLKYNPLCIKRLYERLFKDIKNKNYTREKIE